MKNFTLLGLILFTLFGVAKQDAQAQLLKGLFKNKLATELLNEQITLNQADTTIVVPYNLTGYRNRYYTVKLSYSNNNGTSYKGPLRSVMGDVGDSIRAGGSKKIAWKFKKDNPYFDGKNISFKLEVIEKPKIAIGGPQNALRSILIPGLGDAKVRNGYRYGWIAVGTYASLATGGYFAYKAQKTYKDYKNRLANTSGEHDQYFKDAKRYQTYATTFFATGIAVWAGDVIGVYFRGLKNKRRIAREKERLEIEKQGTTSSFRLIPYSDGNSGNLVVIWKF